MTKINNRYEFMYLFDCIDGNPNGDPDAGNQPRIDPETLVGLVSDVAIKRRIRNYVNILFDNEMPNSIFIENSTNLNVQIANARSSEESKTGKTSKEQVRLASEWMCSRFYDVRAFGAVMSTGPNAGQVRGPVQIAFSRSIDPVLPLDISITRMAVAEPKKIKDKPAQYFQDWEDKQPEDELRTMGRKSLIPYGLYKCCGFISAGLAEKTGFSEEDLDVLWESLTNMFEHDRSSSKGLMSAQKLIIFKHVGTDSDPEQKIRQAKLGCAPAQKLFKLVQIAKKSSVVVPRSIDDYDIKIDRDNIPAGVEIVERL